MPRNSGNASGHLAVEDALRTQQQVSFEGTERLERSAREGGDH